MKVLYLTSECVPFIKTGGLADVAGSLPKILKKKGIDIRVVCPLYSIISDEYRKKMKKILEFYVDLDWKHQYTGVYEYKKDGVIYYFLDNMEYFDRPSPYGYGDDGERFIYFSKACTLLPKYLNWKPDIIHSNDWHSAMTNIFINDFRGGDPYYNDIRTLFTIHNLKYQGIFSPELLRLAGLSGSYFNENDLKYYDSINFMKGAIIHSTAFNTVSPNYAQEIQYPFYGESLDGVIRKYNFKLSGIVNGIDYEEWNPETDKNIVSNYSVKNFKEKKSKNKLDIQRLYSLPQREDVAMIGLVSRLTSMKGIDLIRYIMEELLQEDVQFVILGTGDYTYEEMFRYFEWKYPKKVSSRIYYNSKESNKIYAASDLFMMPSVSEPCGISQMISMRYGTLPIVREAGGLKNTVEPYNKYTKEGTGFSFANINAHELLFTTKKALDLYYNDKETFNILVKNAMNKRLDWNKSADEYIELYNKIKA
ncbi:MAG: glycogen synthase GlgA [Peptoniphilaceae bacterium]|nr:glycogen synthase GlgA [Peptoniphilaceae bacterium]MDD7383537.1 glycogen synthase GlgA [Peptoniphilaceae bacterium]MDY3738710.1 glycogen synthase GlgA [Peptoniphilaceae bacterium]